MQAIEPYNAFMLITPGDTDAANLNLLAPDYGPVRAIYVGGGSGALAMVNQNGNAQLLSGVVVGTILPISPKRINSTNTTATLLMALYRV